MGIRVPVLGVRSKPSEPTLTGADSFTTGTFIFVRLLLPTRQRARSLAMAPKQNIRQVEGILRSVPDPGQIVYDLRFWFCASSHPFDTLLTWPLSPYFASVISLEPTRRTPTFRLPKDGETNILITSALPYCNNVPHLGMAARLRGFVSL